MMVPAADLHSDASSYKSLFSRDVTLSRWVNPGRNIYGTNSSHDGFEALSLIPTCTSNNLSGRLEKLTIMQPLSPDQGELRTGFAPSLCPGDAIEAGAITGLHTFQGVSVMNYGTYVTPTKLVRIEHQTRAGGYRIGHTLYGTRTQ